MSKRLLILVAVTISTLGQAYGQALPPAMQRSIGSDLVPAYRNGDTVSVLQFAASIANSVEPERWPMVDTAFDRHELPSLAELLVDSRLELIQANLGSQLPAPSAQEVQLILPALEAKLEQTLQETVGATGKDAEAKAESFADFDALLWNAHVAKNQLLAVGDLVTFGQRLAKSGQGRQLRDPGGGASAADRLSEIAEQLTEFRQQLDEHTIELRIDRLDYAHSVLNEPSDLVDRLKAAWVVEVDGPLLESFTESIDPTELISQRLQEPSLAESIHETVAEARELAGEPLMQKSRLFHTGLHWWLRGRYGKGPVGNGFLKHPQALKSPQEMFGLFMPVEFPKPTPPSQGYQIPEVDRRHHYGWMFEYRRVTRTVDRDVKKVSRTKKEAKSATKLSRFY